MYVSKVSSMAVRLGVNAIEKNGRGEGAFSSGWLFVSKGYIDREVVSSSPSVQLNRASCLGMFQS